MSEFAKKYTLWGTKSKYKGYNYYKSSDNLAGLPMVNIDDGFMHNFTTFKHTMLGHWAESGKDDTLVEVLNNDKLLDAELRIITAVNDDSECGALPDGFRLSHLVSELKNNYEEFPKSILELLSPELLTYDDLVEIGAEDILYDHKPSWTLVSTDGCCDDCEYINDLASNLVKYRTYTSPASKDIVLVKVLSAIIKIDPIPGAMSYYIPFYAEYALCKYDTNNEEDCIYSQTPINYIEEFLTVNNSVWMHEMSTVKKLVKQLCKLVLNPAKISHSVRILSIEEVIYGINNVSEFLDLFKSDVNCKSYTNDKKISATPSSKVAFARSSQTAINDVNKSYIIPISSVDNRTKLKVLDNYTIKL